MCKKYAKDNRMIIIAPIKNENGIALIIALMLLVLLTLLGIAATTTSVLEVQIAGNDRDYKANLYKAETAAYEAARTMGEMTDGPGASNLKGKVSWIPAETAITDENDLANLDNWDEDAITEGIAIYSTYINDNTTAFAAKYIGPDSLGMDNQNQGKKYLFSVLGHSENNSGQALVELGLKLQF